MSKQQGFLPKGRASLPEELKHFGVHLVYSEGTETEPNYVNNIKANIAQKYDKLPSEIQIIQDDSNKSRHTVELANYAYEDVVKRKNQGQKIDHVWIFFDKDDFDDFQNAYDMICRLNDSDKLGDSNKYNSDGLLYNIATGATWHACWSNQCFELWLCLYFSYYTSANNRDAYRHHLERIPKLKKQSFKYEKNIKCIHDILIRNGGSLSNAISYAKKLFDSNGTGEPSTGVYLFAEYFKNYLQ